jgi:hypothetical protein
MPARDRLIRFEWRDSRGVIRADEIQDYLQRLTPLARSNLLTELDRLETCGAEIPGAAEALKKLRAEFCKDGATRDPLGNPARYFFAPLEPLLAEGEPEHTNSGRILRGSLSPIWEWITRDLLPTMARDYVKGMNELITAGNQRQARLAAATFQTKVVKSIEGTLGSPDGADQVRTRLATYTASQAAYVDLTKTMCVLRARDALAKFNEALPETIRKFDDALVSKITASLDAFKKANPEEIPFALALVATRLRTPWELMRLATEAARSKKASDVAAAPYAIAVSMVLDRLDDKRSTVRVALKNNRVMVAKEILAEIYGMEYAMQSGIDLLDRSDWGERLNHLMDAIAALVEAEVSRFPDNIGHVLGSRRRRRQSIAGHLTGLASKARSAMNGGAALCRKLAGPREKSHA